MIQFASPWFLAFLPLPVLAWFVLPRLAQRGAVRVPDSVLAFLQDQGKTSTGPRGGLPDGMVPKALGWLALVVALAGPYLQRPSVLTPTGRDIVVAVDLSASMAEKDMVVAGSPVPRIDVIRDRLSEFLAGRKGDRIALIGFATDAFLIAPFTFDTRAVSRMLHEVSIGLPGRKTDLGQAIGLTVKLLRDEEPGERILVLISDGEANAGDLAARDAAEMAAAMDLKIFAIGFAGEVDPRNRAHLAALAEMTGGEFHAAVDPSAMQAAYNGIERLIPVTPESAGSERRQDWRWLPLIVALGCLFFVGWREHRDP